MCSSQRITSKCRKMFKFRQIIDIIYKKKIAQSIPLICLHYLCHFCILTMSVRIMKNYVYVCKICILYQIDRRHKRFNKNSLASVFVYVKSLTKQCAQVGWGDRDEWKDGPRICRNPTVFVKRLINVMIDASELTLRRIPNFQPSSLKLFNEERTDTIPAAKISIGNLKNAT